MARMRFTLGARYLLQGQVYLVRQVLVDSQLVVENQSFGGQVIVTQDDLCAAWARGELRFEVHGPNTRRSSDSPIATAYTFADFQHLPPKLRDEACGAINSFAPCSSFRSRNAPGRLAQRMLRSSLRMLPMVLRNPESGQPWERQSAAPALSAG